MQIFIDESGKPGKKSRPGPFTLAAVIFCDDAERMAVDKRIRELLTKLYGKNQFRFKDLNNKWRLRFATEMQHHRFSWAACRLERDKLPPSSPWHGNAHVYENITDRLAAATYGVALQIRKVQNVAQEFTVTYDRMPDPNYMRGLTRAFRKQFPRAISELNGEPKAVKAVNEPLVQLADFVAGAVRAGRQDLLRYFRNGFSSSCLLP